MHNDFMKNTQSGQVFGNIPYPKEARHRGLNCA